MPTFAAAVTRGRQQEDPQTVFTEAVDGLLAGVLAPPCSFRLGAETEADFWPRCARQVSRTVRAAGVEHTCVFSDPVTGLQITWQVLQHHGFAAVEWTAWVDNPGLAPAPVLADLSALDLAWRSVGDAFLYRSPGAAETREDFQLQRFPLQTIREPRAEARFGAGCEGRSSVDWLPFFNLQTGTDGLVVAVGWSGQWHAAVERHGDETRLRAGMDGLRLALPAGTGVRTPRVLLVYWRGALEDGQNQLRRLLLQHVVPQVGGQPVQVPSCYGAWGGAPTPVHLQQLQFIQDRALAYDVYWIDAGWYGTSDKPCPNVFEGEWGKTGDWRVNRLYHPDGLAPVSRQAHQAGLQFLLWVEPERALHGAPITLEHPEWFLQRQPGMPREVGENLILNLGNPEARQWVTELVSGLVTEHGLDWYRQDFNISPLEYWRANDAADQQGLTENRYIEGLYAFWDGLRRRHPQLRIDNCASGGRRLDLELLYRSIPLWRNDYNCFSHLDPEVLQVHGYGLSHWVPLHATSPFNSAPGDTYRFRSIVAPGVVFGMDEVGNVEYDEASYPWDWHRRMLDEQRRARPFWYGDLYPLTRCTAEPDAWLALQLHRADLDAGVILAFRRAASPLTQAAFRLRGVDGDAVYTLEDADSGRRWSAGGSELAGPGLALAMPEPRSSCLLFYRRAPGCASER